MLIARALYGGEALERPPPPPQSLGFLPPEILAAIVINIIHQRMCYKDSVNTDIN